MFIGERTKPYKNVSHGLLLLQGLINLQKEKTFHAKSTIPDKVRMLRMCAGEIQFLRRERGREESDKKV